MQFTPYLNFDGQCAEAFRFYEKALGGKIVVMQTFGETPEMGEMPPALRDRVLHARLVVGDQLLMGSDSQPDQHQPAQGFAVALQIDTPAEAERIYAALAEDGTVELPLQQTFFAERFGMLKDRYGTPWMLNCEQAR
jgi:PhnB protein